MMDENKKIKLDVVIINNEQITVIGSSTSFFGESFCPKSNINDLIKRHNKLVKDARAKGITVSLKAGHKRTLQEFQHEYEVAYAEYVALYNELKELVQAKVEQGIYMPTSEDAELNMLSGISHKIRTYFYASTPISQVREAQYRIEEFEREIYRDDCTLIKIVL